MRVRLLFTYTPENLDSTPLVPLAPSVLIEEAETGIVGEFGTWGGVTFDHPLDAITDADIRDAIGLSVYTRIYLPQARVFPSDDIYSPEFQKWRVAWWQEAAAELRLSSHLLAVA